VSTAIAVATPHRGEAFEASRYIIEELKQRLPIWKREHYLDGGSDWVGSNTTPNVEGQQSNGSKEVGSGE